MRTTGSGAAAWRRGPVRMLLAGSLLAAGCAGSGGLGPPAPPPALDQVPFFPQQAWQCGPAALATVLNHSGVQIAPGALTDSIYLPGRRGSLQLELIAAARRSGRIPWVMPPEPAALWTELAAARPVLVLQDLGPPGFRRWHYAVVVGYDGDRRRVILRSGIERERAEPLRRFMASWRRSGYWALVVPPPDELPATAGPQEWTRVLLQSAEVMDAAALDPYWHSAAAHWPGIFIVSFAAANHAHARGQLQEAEALYRGLLQRGIEEALVRNNLANLLLDRGCVAAARSEALAASAALPRDAPYRNAIETTLARVEQAQAAGDAAACAPILPQGQ